MSRTKTLTTVALSRPWNEKSTINISFEEVSPALAQQWLDENHDNQRKVKRNVVAQYVRQMKNGQWLSDNGETVKFTEDGLSDGQHRLHAIIEYGQPMVLMVMRGLQSDTMTSLDMGSKRTLADILKIHGYETVKGLSESQLSSVLNGIYTVRDYAITAKKESKSQRIDSSRNARATPLELYEFLMANPKLSKRLNKLSEFKLPTIAKQAPLSPIITGWFICDIIDPEKAAAILMTFQDCTPQTPEGSNCPSYMLFRYIQKARASKVKIHRFEYPGLFLWALDHMILEKTPNRIITQQSHMPGQGHEGTRKLKTYLASLKIHMGNTPQG